MILHQHPSRLGRVSGSSRSPRRFQSRAVLLAAGSVVTLLSPRLASAGNYNWDPAHNGSGSDGSGNWDLASSNWASGGDQIWPNDTSTAIFGSGGTAGTVTLTTAINAGGLTFNATGSGDYTIAASASNGLTLGGTTPTITVNSGSPTISAPLFGTAGLTTAGVGTLNLSGANTYSGGTTVTAGTLNLLTGGTLGTSTNTLTLGAATPVTTDTTAVTANINTSATVGAFTNDVNSASASILTIGTGQTLTVNGPMMIGQNSTTAAITTVFNTFTGSTDSTPGAGGTLTVTGTTTIGGANTNSTSTKNTTTADLTGLSNFNLNAGTGTSLYVGAGQNIKGVLNLAANNLINVGTIDIGTSTLGVLPGNDNAQTGSAINFGTGTNTVEASVINIGNGKSNGTMGFTSGNTTGSVSITGTGGTGTAAITIGNESVATGTSTASSLLLAGHLATVQAGTIIVGESSGNTASTATATVTFDTGTFNAANLNLAVITGSATGATIGSAGTFTLGTGATSTGVLNVSSGFILANNADTATTNAGIATGVFTINGGAANISSNITVASTSTHGSTSATLNLNGGVLNMGNGVAATNFQIGSATALLTAFNMPASGSATIENLGGGGIFATGGTGATSSSGGLTMGGAGTLILAGTNTYSGTTTINSGGTIQVGSSSLAGTLPAASSVSNSGTLAFGGSSASSFSGSISGGGAVNQLGTGATTFSGTNSYTGSTTISGGTLIVTGSLLSTGNVYITPASTSAILSGTGSVGNVTLSSPGAIHPGASAADGNIGTLGINSLTVSGGDLRFDIGGTAGDQIVDAGSANFTGGTVSVALDSAPSVSTYTLLTATGGISGAPTLTTTSIGRTTFSLSETSTTLVLHVGGGPATLTWDDIGSGNGTTWDNIQSQQNWKNGSSADYYYDADNVTFNDVNAGKYAVNLTTTVSPGSVTFNNTGAYTISGAGKIAGTTGLTLSGSGSVTLQTANTYSGNTNVNAGTLILSSGGGISSTNLNVNAGALNVNSGGTVSSANLNVAGGTATINSGGTVSSASVNVNSGSLTVASGGSITGAAATVASGASLTVASGGLIPAAWNLTDNGTVTLSSAATTIGTLGGTGVVNLNGDTLTVAGGGTVGAVLQDGGSAGSLSVSGGTLILTGANTYSGATTIAAASTLQIGAGGTTGSLGSTTVTDNGTLTYNLSSNPTIVTPVIDNGTIIYNSAGSLTVNSTITGAGTVQQTGAGLTALSGTITGFTGTYSLGAGTLEFNYASPTTIANALTASASLGIIANVGKLTFTSNDSLGTKAITFNVTPVAGTMPDGVPADVEITGNYAVSSGVGLIKTGLGTLALSGTGDNAALGATVNAGTLLLNKASTTGIHAIGGGGLTINSGGTVQMATTSTGIYQIYNGGATTTINHGGTFDLNGQTEGINSLTIGDATGAGLLENSAAGTYSTLYVGTPAGGTDDLTTVTTATGTFKLAGAATVTVASNSSLEIQVNGAAAAAGASNTLTANGAGTVLLTGITDDANVNVAVTSGTLVLAKTSTGNVHGASGVVGVSSGATLQLGGSGGDQIYNGYAAGTADSGVLNMNGTFDLNGQSEGFDKLTGSGTVINSQTGTTSYLTLGTNNGIGPTTSDFTGTITGNILVQKYNGATTPTTQLPVILSGANTYSAGTYIGVGILQIGDGGTGGTLGTGPVDDEDTLAFDRSDAALNVSNVISGGGLVNQIGTGTTTLSAANTYSGNTNVNAGTLKLAAGGTIASSNLNVAAGATANIIGTLTNTPTVNANGAVTFGPGTSGFNAVTIAALNLASTGSATLLAPGAHANRTVLITSSLSLAGSTGAWGGLIDLTSNDLIVNGGSLSTLTDQIREGYSNGTWTGTAGIKSSTAAGTSVNALGIELNNDGSGNTLLNTFDGQPVTTSDVLIKYTYYGDADLSGTVNGSDYTLIDSGFNNQYSGWHNGDFNYDGVVNGNDYTLIDNAFNNQHGIALGDSAPADMVAGNTAEIAGPSAAAVPEPTTLGLLGIGAIGLLSRRRRRVSSAAI